MVLRQHGDGRPMNQCENGRKNKADLILKDARRAMIVAPSCHEGGIHQDVRYDRQKLSLRLLPTFGRIRARPKAKTDPAAQARARNTAAVTIHRSLPLQRNAVLCMLTIYFLGLVRQ